MLLSFPETAFPGLKGPGASPPLSEERLIQVALTRGIHHRAPRRTPLVIRHVPPPMTQDKHYRRAMQLAQARGEASTGIGFSLTLAFLIASVLIVVTLLLL